MVRGGGGGGGGWGVGRVGFGVGEEVNKISILEAEPPAYDLN